MLLAVTRVEVVPDWLTYVTAGATVLAAILALGSIVYAENLTRRERHEGQEAMNQARLDAVRERRAQWELSILAEMARQHSVTGDQHLSGYVRSLIREDAPDDDLPLLRRVTGIHPTQVGADKVEAIRAALLEAGEDPGRGLDYSVQQRVTVEVGAEITDAIDRRLRPQ